MSEFLFVYGTLQTRSPHPASVRLREEVRPAGPATVGGRLYNLGPYPALVPCEPGEAVVYGELLELLAPAASLPWLDAYEGPEYQRRGITAVPRRGNPVEAWCYVYAGEPADRPLIASGVWPV